MKKVIIAVLLVFMFITPALASEPWKEALKTPFIYGDEEFRDAVTDAMELLYKKDRLHFDMVAQNITLIIQGVSNEKTLDGKPANAKVHTSIVTLMPGYMNDKSTTPEMLASTLTHEATHIEIYKTIDDEEVLNNTIAMELIATEQELITLELLDAPEWIIKACKERIKEFKEVEP